MESHHLKKELRSSLRAQGTTCLALIDSSHRLCKYSMILLVCMKNTSRTFYASLTSMPPWMRTTVWLASTPKWLPTAVNGLTCTSFRRVERVHTFFSCFTVWRIFLRDSISCHRRRRTYSSGLHYSMMWRSAEGLTSKEKTMYIHSRVQERFLVFSPKALQLE